MIAMLDSASLVREPADDVEGAVPIDVGSKCPGGTVRQGALGVAAQALLEPGPRRVSLTGRVEVEPDGIPRVFASLQAVGGVADDGRGRR